MGKSVEVVTVDVAERSPAHDGYADPTTGTEKVLAEVLAEIVGVERVPVESNFFDDLGADSLMMTHFCARVRKRACTPPVSMKDIYRNPTVRSLATALADAAPAPAAAPPAPVELVTPVGTVRYAACGALQLLIFVGYTFLAALIATSSYEWISAGTGALDVYLRSVLFGAAAFLFLCALPIVAKWVLIGRWKPQRIRIWSLAYVRFWLVKTLVRSNPLVLVAGGRSHTSGSSPLAVLYLRALGAKVGRGVAIFSRNMPVCTDLLTIGDGTVIRKDAFVNCYRAQAGMIEIGAVTLGKDVFVGEGSVVDIETSLGDGAQLGHASALHAGQAVPGGERWHGCPAQRTEDDYRAVGAARCGGLRRTSHAVLQLLAALLLYVPLALGGVSILLADFPQLTGLLEPGPAALATWTFYVGALVVSFVVFFGALLGGLLVVVTVPRVLHLVMRPDRTYRLYGLHYAVHRTIGRLTNIKFFLTLFGDSSYVVHYLRCLGYDLSHVEQTGSNFGTDVRHETPFLVSIGSGTMVADGLSVINADFSSTSFRLSRVTIGPHNFLGNRIAYPSRGRTGDNCLLATKVLVPISGEIREGIGLLGSPSFEIPRSVERDSRFDHLRRGDELRRGLRAKNGYNLRSMALFLMVRWVHFFGVTVLALAVADLYQLFGVSALTVEILVLLLFTMTYFVLVERSILRFRSLQPRFCSIYDPYFWWHERYWKLVIPPFDMMFSGTPFKNVVSRLLGVRIGHRVFDDGCALTERTLVSIGDDCTLNAGAVIQSHSQEDGTFKSDRIAIGAGCTLGVAAFVHYGVTVGDGAVLAPDSFVMKGEEIPPHARWGGHPAREMAEPRPALSGGGPR